MVPECTRTPPAPHQRRRQSRLSWPAPGCHRPPAPVHRPALSRLWKAGRGQLGLAYDFRESASSDFDDRSEVTAFYTLSGATGNNFQIDGLVGLSDGSPDYGAGVNYGWKF